MKWGTTWIREHLGVTPQMLRDYERIGLIERDPDGAPRRLEEGDLKRVMTARLLGRMGLRLDEIRSVLVLGDVSLLDSLDLHVRRMESELRELETTLGFARMVRITGRLPDLPDFDEEEDYQDYLQRMYAGWNTRRNRLADVGAEIVDLLLKPDEERTAADEMNEEKLLAEINAGTTQHAGFSDAMLGFLMQETDAGGMEAQQQIAMLHALIKQGAEGSAKDITPEVFSLTMQMMLQGLAGQFLKGQLGEERIARLQESLEIYGCGRLEDYEIRWREPKPETE